MLSWFTVLSVLEEIFKMCSLCAPRSALRSPHVSALRSPLSPCALRSALALPVCSSLHSPLSPSALHSAPRSPRPLRTPAPCVPVCSALCSPLSPSAPRSGLHSPRVVSVSVPSLTGFYRQGLFGKMGLVTVDSAVCRKIPLNLEHILSDFQMDLESTSPKHSIHITIQFLNGRKFSGSNKEKQVEVS